MWKKKYISVIEPAFTDDDGECGFYWLGHILGYRNLDIIATTPCVYPTKKLAEKASKKLIKQLLKKKEK